MRWYVDLLSENREPASTLVVEATSWQAALQGACGLRGESVSLEQITVELIPDGYRALNTETRAAFELRKAPDDTPLSRGAGGAPAPGPFADEDTFAPTSSELAEAEEAAAEVLASQPGVKATPAEMAPGEPAGAAPAAKGQGAEGAPKGNGPEKGPEGAPKGAPAKAPGASAKAAPVAAKAADKTKGAAPAGKGAEAGGKPAGAPVKAAGSTSKTPLSASKVKASAKAPGAAPKAEVGSVPEAAPTLPVVAPPLPAARQASATRTFGSEGQVVADAKLRAGPPALPAGKAAAKPPPLNLVPVGSQPEAQGAAAGGQILFARGEDPSAQSPLTYREVALCFPEGTAEAEAERVLRLHLQALVEQLSAAPSGKYVALAAFDVRFEGRPPKPPLVTLTWKDWHGTEPRVAYPAQQQALNASMAGMSMGAVFPSPFASLPGNLQAPGAKGRPPPFPGGGSADAGPYEVLFARGEDPSARSPLTYREVALCLPEGTAEAEAEQVLRQYWQALQAQLAAAPPGKYLALAAFDVRFEGRPPKPPLVTLTWKDWHGAEPKVAYPAQQRALHGSMAGASMAGVFPSPFASLPGNAPSPFAPPAAAASGFQPPGALPTTGGAHILFARGEDPSAQSPLTYREVALCFPEGTAEAEAERILRLHLQALIEQLSAAPPGKYVALAAFDVRFEGRPPKPPLVTLTWKDWHGAEPKVAYPAQQRALHGSMAGASMAGVFPSPFASLPGNAPSPFNAMPGGGSQTVPLPRADAALRPANATPPGAGPSRPGAARAPRDAKAGGGGGGGNDSSEGWPPGTAGGSGGPAGRMASSSESSSSDVFASPAVMAARQRPVIQPLPGSSDVGEEMPTAVVMAPYVPPEAMLEAADPHIPVFTGEFAIVDEPTPLLGAPALAPEAFRDDLKPTRERPLAAPSPFDPVVASAPPAPAASAPASTPAPPDAASPAPPLSPPPAPPAPAPRSAPPTPRSAPPSPPPAPRSAPPAPRLYNDKLTAKMKWAPGPAPKRHASSSDLLAQLFEAMPALQSIGSEVAGVEFVLDLLGREIPSRVMFCHLYDAARREFVVAGARAPSPSAGGRLVGARTPELDPSIEPVLGQRGALVVPDASADARYQGGRWGLSGEALGSLVAVAVRGPGGGLLGLLELGNPGDGAPFGEAEGRGLEYVAEQFAEFLSRLGAPSSGAGR